MFAKRFFDVMLSAIAILLLAPLIGLIAILIWIGMGRPVLFKQIRPGLRGKPFTILKFRTMNNLWHGEARRGSDAARLTSLGKILRSLSLDEVPELWNVLKGEMSLVGPRPLLMEYLPRYTSFHARRMEVRPGITGWAQVNGRNTLSWDEKFELDVWYVDHQSFFLDFKILWMTVLQVLKRKGINAEGHATMPKFLGSQGQKRIKIARKKLRRVKSKT